MSEANTEQEGTVLLATPRGFCAGVVRAIDIVKIALQKYGTPLYVRREIVHNKYVVSELRSRGVIFVESIEDVPAGGRVIFSAHGVSPAVREEAASRQLHVIDATCPLVTKVHHEAVRYARGGYTIILIGHGDHDEVIGTCGEAPEAIRVISSIEQVETLEVPDPARLAFLTQTTLSVDDTRHIIDRLRMRFPGIQGPSSDDICYATQNRQNVVAQLAERAEVILVVGSSNSSNSQRLVEVARGHGTESHLIDSPSGIDSGWLRNRSRIGLTAGASAPERLVEEVVAYLREMGFTRVEHIGDVREEVEFALPAELRDSPAEPEV